MVRHRVDPRVAIAAVLGLVAEDIQVREVAGSELPVKATMASTNLPNIPSNQNTAVADKKSGHAGRGSPAGDR